MNANMSYLALGEKEREYTWYLAILLQSSLWKPQTITFTDSHKHTRTYKHTHWQSGWGLAGAGCQNRITACPVHVCAGHVVPCSVRRRLKWLLTQEDSKLTAPMWTPSPSCHYNTIHCTINIPHSSAGKTKGGSISGLNCENHKEDVIKQKCLGTHAERWMLNRGGRALLRWHQGQPLNSCMGVPSVMEDRKWRAIQGNTDRLTATRGGESSPV